MKAKDIGNLGEDLAVKFLLEKGYELLERNFFKPFGEIDIIAKDKDYVVFIEVKARKNVKFGFPREFVNKNKIKKIGYPPLPPIFIPNIFCAIVYVYKKD